MMWLDGLTAWKTGGETRVSWAEALVIDPRLLLTITD